MMKELIRTAYGSRESGARRLECCWPLLGSSFRRFA